MNPTPRPLSTSAILRGLLKTNPDAGHCDALFAVWQEQGLELSEIQKQFIRKSVSPRTIISLLDRCRKSKTK